MSVNPQICDNFRSQVRYDKRKASKKATLQTSPEQELHSEEAADSAGAFEHIHTARGGAQDAQDAP